MRRPIAVVALFVLTWSNATALQCAVSTPRPSPDQTAHPLGHEGHAPSRANPAGEDAGGHEGSHDEGHQGRADCGVLMACGAALGTRIVAEPTRTETLERIAAAPASRPSTADRTQDPPPPRRIA